MLVVRILLGTMFALAGVGKFLSTPMFSAMVAQAGLPFPTALALAAGVLEIACSAGLLLGYLTRPSAVLLMTLTFVVSLLIHDFWALTGEAATQQLFYFLKNIVIFLLLLTIFRFGPGRFAVEKRNQQ